jgi:hypothetical protein
MGIQSFPIATPTPVQTTPAQGTSLAQLMSIAQGAQAYQQAQQLNPLQLQQAQQLLEQAKVGTEKAKRTLEPEVSAKESEAKRLATEAEKAGIDAKAHYANQARNVYGGYLSDADFLNGNSEKMVEKLNRAKDYLEDIGIPMHGSRMHEKLIELAKKDPKEAYQQIVNGVNTAAGSQNQFNQANPTVGTNAAGQTVRLNPITNKMEVIGASQVNPTTPGVSNFSEYQKDLTNRVAAGTQIDMRLNEAEDLMSKVKTGAGTRAFADVAQKLQAIGAPQALVDKAAGGDLSAVQSLNKFIAQSVTSSIGQMSGNPTANMMNDYLKNNPDVNSDPRALQRFIDFAHKQNEMAYEEQRFLTDKVKNKALNPDTHPAEAQQYILDKFVKPKEQMQNQVRNQPKGQPEASKGHGKVTKTGTFNGKPVVQYEDGFVEYK